MRAAAGAEKPLSLKNTLAATLSRASWSGREPVTGRSLRGYSAAAPRGSGGHFLRCDVAENQRSKAFDFLKMRLTRAVSDLGF
jgi:hypothetical protein